MPERRPNNCESREQSGERREERGEERGWPEADAVITPADRIT